MHTIPNSPRIGRSALKIGVLLTLLILPYCYYIASAYVLVGHANSGNTLQSPSPEVHRSGKTDQGLLLRDTSPASQTHRIIVILIRLADVTNSTSMQTINSTVFNKMTSYFDEVSYHKMAIVGNITDWISLSNTTEQYGKDTGSGSSGIDDVDGDGIPDSWWLIRDAMNKVDNTTNFADYDTIMVVHSGRDQAKSSIPSDIWSAYYSGLEIPTNDGITITTGIVLSEDDPMGIFAHEFGHSLGLPDLYSINGGTERVGKWDLMANGAWLGSPQGESPSHPTSYCKIHLSWIYENSTMVGRMIQGVIDPLEIKGTNYTAIKIPVTTDRYYLIEVRQKIGYDAYLPAAGVLILYVDETLPSGGGIVTVKYSQSLDQATYTTAPGSNIFLDNTMNINVTVILAYSSSYRVSVSLIRPDNTPPRIDLRNPVPWTWPSTQPATVSAVITDTGTNSSSVRNATLFHSSDGRQSWNRVKMTPSLGDMYSAVIPPQNTSQVEYYIEAYDYAGNPAIGDNNGQYYVYGNVEQTLVVIIVALIGISLACVATIVLVRRRRAPAVEVGAPKLYS